MTNTDADLIARADEAIKWCEAENDHVPISMMYDLRDALARHSAPLPALDEAAVSAMLPYRKQINETPELLSLLYDIDLLPEQIRLPVNVSRMIAVCEIFKRHSAPLPADVAGLVAIIEYFFEHAENCCLDVGEPGDAFDKLTSLIASQAREIERLKHALCQCADQRLAAEARVREMELKFGDEIYNRECADKLVAAAEARATAHDALLASCLEFLPILERQLASVNPGGAAEASKAYQMASARVERMRAAMRLAEGTERADAKG